MGEKDRILRKLSDKETLVLATSVLGASADTDASRSDPVTAIKKTLSAEEIRNRAKQAKTLTQQLERKDKILRELSKLKERQSVQLGDGVYFLE